MQNDPEYIIVHTAAFEGDISMKIIDKWHRKRGFREAGYHYFINYDGEIEKGRDEWEQGAHCIDMGMNMKSIGICLEGHGDKERWTDMQKQMFYALARREMEEYGIPPKNVLGHRETGANKSCPGNLIDMDEVRSLVSEPMDADPVEVLPPEVIGQHDINVEMTRIE